MHNKKDLIKNISATVLFLILAAVIGGSFYLVDLALAYDGGKNMKLAEKVLQKYPEAKIWCDSMERANALRDTFITNSEGRRLHAIYASAKDSTENTAVIIHGYGNNCMSYIYLGHLFNEKLNFNILMPDLHGHGLSDGDDVQMGLKDADDVLLWTEVANNIFGRHGNTKMVIHGTSMGAATAMVMSGKENKPFIKCYIEDSGYTSAWDEFEFQLSELYGLPAFPIMYTSSLLCDIKYGWTFKEASPVDYVAKCNKPMLFIHSDNDTFVPSWMVHPLYEAKHGQKDLWIVHKSAHTKAYHDYPEEYIKRISVFLKKYGF